jgi:MFS family permease
MMAAFTFLLRGIAPTQVVGQLTLRQRMGWDALALLRNHDHRVVFITAALFNIPLAALYPFTPPQLVQLGFKHTSAWMSCAQVSEIIAMFALAGLFARWRLKWIFALGLAFGLVRYALCAFNGRASLLAGISLHGCSYTLVFITAQIYLDERVDAAWRARAQALMALMTNGFGNLIGYLGTGWWFNDCTNEAGTRWSLYWGGLAAVVVAVLVYFLTAYHGIGMAPRRRTADQTRGP